MFDSAPGDVVSSGGVVSSPVASVFQTDKIALRMRTSMRLGAASKQRDRMDERHELVTLEGKNSKVVF